MEEFTLFYGGKGLWYGSFSHIRKAGFLHAISTRLGGKSQGPFSSLNLALHTGDVPEDVIENRRILCSALRINHREIIAAEQVHGDNVAIVTAADAGRGSLKIKDVIANTDALITKDKNIPLMLFYADCVPVLIADKKKRCGALVHAGWQGTTERIVQKTITAMQDAFGTEPADCLAGIAPSIGPCCYQVDAKVADKVKEGFSNWSELIIADGSLWRYNLWEANRQQLLAMGLSAANIVTSCVCTCCNSHLFFSYRADNKLTGRICAAMQIS